jgi:hypothetical protein
MLTLVSYADRGRGPIPTRYVQRSLTYPHRFVVYYFAWSDDNTRVVDFTNPSVYDRADMGEMLVKWLADGETIMREEAN